MRRVSALLAGALFVAASSASADWKLTGRVGGSISAVAAQGSFLYVGVGTRLYLYDVADPAAPREIGSTLSFTDWISEIFVSGSRAYIAAGTDGVHIVDIADPASPRLIGHWDSPGSAEGIAVDGTSLFVADGPFGVHIVDVSNPSAPARVASAYETTFAFDVAIHQQYAFVAAADAGLLVVDVGARDKPRELGAFDTPGFARDIAISGSTLCLADMWGGVRVLSIEQPAAPRELSALSLPGWAFAVALSGTTLHVADGAQGLRSVDLSDASRPREIGSVAIPLKVSWRVAVANGRAFVGVRTEGVRVIDATQPAALREVGSIFPFANAAAVATTGNFACVLTADEGLRVVDLTQPDRPRQRGGAATLQGTVGAIETVGDRHVYVASGVQTAGATLDVFDIADADRPSRAASLRVFNYGRELVSRGSLLYMPDEFGLEVFDVSNPASPSFLGKIAYAGDGGATTVALSPQYAFGSAGRNGVQIVDVADPAHMQIAGKWLPEFGSVSQVAWRDGYLYVTTEPTPELVVLDVHDPLHPVRTGSVPLGGIFTGDVLLDGPYAFVANGAAGVAVVDVRDPARPLNVAQVRIPGFALELALSGGRILVAAASGGLVVVENVPQSTSDASEAFHSPQPILAAASRTYQTQVPRASAARSARPTASRNVVVTSVADSGPGTLREALANLAAGDQITFDPSVFPPKAPATIDVMTVLPHIKREGIVIDASNAGVILDGSRLSGPFESGIEIESSSRGNTIRGLQIMNFPSCGIFASGNGGNIIGGDRSRGAGPTGEGNVLSRNRKSGIHIGNPNHNRIVGNLIGTDVTGRVALGEQQWGVNLFYQQGNGTELSGDRVGGDEPWEANVIAGNLAADVELHNAGGHAVIGNFIGVDASGSRAISAALSVQIDASSDNIIRRNVIGGRGAQIIDQGACCNAVIDNWFGVTPDGRYMERQITSDAGIVVHESLNRIAGNIFGGINYSAVRAFGIGDSVAETIIAGNTFLGIASGRPILGGGSLDLEGASRTFIGGTTEAFRNRINGGGSGISMHSGVDHTFILGNSVGNADRASMTNVTGIDARGSEFTFIQGNEIANNSGKGVIAGVMSTRIRRNALYGNRNGAIVSTTPPPLITSVTSTVVSGTACAHCAVEIFSDDESQARFYEGAANADAGGRFTFTKGVTVRGPNITATATDTQGNTSALSAAVTAPPQPPRHRTVRH
jgi:hypothetical protein